MSTDDFGPTFFLDTGETGAGSMNNFTPQQLDDAMTQALRNLDMARFDQLAAEADRRHAEQAKRLESDTALLNGALWYAGQGLPVFPCQVKGKMPLIPAAHPAGSPERANCRGQCGRHGHGLYDATTDPDTITDWWTRCPQSNIGLPTGLRYDVIDVDGPAGYRSLSELKAEHRWPASYAGRVLTPSGGMHVYIEATGAGNAARYRAGLDYRGAGGYVLAPPSRGANGRRWEWCNPISTEGYRTVYEWEAAQ